MPPPPLFFLPPALLVLQICIANESEGGGVVVVLADRDKEAMEAELHQTLSAADLKGTEVVFRRGSPLSSLDLKRAAAETARSIVVMSEGETQNSADAATLRTVIALKTFPQLAGHVVVEVHVRGAAREGARAQRTLARRQLFRDLAHSEIRDFAE